MKNNILKKGLYFYLICSSSISLVAQKIVPEKYTYNESYSYEELIHIYENLDRMYVDAALLKWGKTDAGHELHTFVINTDEIFDPMLIKQSNKSVLFILNGIHPGEPDGIDASVLWAESLLMRKNLNQFLENTVVVIVPVFNIDGMLNRDCCSRVNQNGPASYGFRANAKNLDLNRDFMKQESKNMQSFIEIFQAFDPDIFVDTHVSNGADYPYTISLIHSSGNRLPEPARSFYTDEMTPALYKEMKQRKWEMIPYVNLHNMPPDNGFEAFYDSPKYSNGFTSLYGTFSFTIETHMLKSYPERVEANKDFLESITEFTNKNSRKIQVYRNLYKEWVKNTTHMPIRFAHDDSMLTYLDFKTYPYVYKKSEVTQQEQLYFDRQQIILKKIPYIHGFKSAYSAAKPKAFVIPYAYCELAEKLKKNGVNMKKLIHDSLMDLQVWYLPNIEFERLSEGRPLFAVRDTQSIRSMQKIQIPEGSFIVEMGTENDAFIMNALHPMGEDSYLRWGYFASHFEQKEYFSSYVFDPLAKNILDENPTLKAAFEKKKEEDKNFAENANAQLQYIYKHSVYAEKSLNKYPIYFAY